MKKSEAWYDLISIVPELKMETNGYLISVGAGNGRNLKFARRTLIVSIDISENLLRNYVADLSHQRVAGSTTHIPVRKNATEEIYSIAVIHHFDQPILRFKAIGEFYRISSIKGKTTITVWRKWRKQLKDKIIAKIMKKEAINEIINHNRPWKDSSGQTLGIRFYHYYTWKELNAEIRASGFHIGQRVIMGGTNGDENFLVRLLKN